MTKQADLTPVIEKFKALQLEASFANHRQLPLILTKTESSQQLLDIFANDFSSINDSVETCGAILFRGFGLEPASFYEKFSSMVNFSKYTFRSTPRKVVGDKVYSATEYPKPETIPQHNENSYTNSWPSRLCFMCVEDGFTGGETPLGFSTDIIENLDANVVEEFTRRGVMYVRNYNDYIDLKWKDVFQTDDFAQVEAYCQKNNIQVERSSTDASQFTTKQVLDATLARTNGDTIWFNQAHLFHHSSVSADYKQMMDNLGIQLPRETFYGDGGEIPEAYIKHISEIYNESKVTFPWQKGDLLLVSNEACTHGRNPYAGSREIWVTMY